MTKRLKLAELIAGSTRDKADQPLPYLADHVVDEDMVVWHQTIHPLFRDLAENGLVPDTGLIVEFGAYQGSSLNLLNDLFGAERVLGYDVYAYTQNPQIVVGDIRKIPLPDVPAALAWNDLSNWFRSPRSKWSAFEWSRKNLMPGGLYIEDAWDYLPEDLDLRDFEIIRKDPRYTVFKKRPVLG